MRDRTGYTLLEVALAMSILTIVSLLGFVVLKTSTDSASLANAKGEIQSGLRDVMTVLGSELAEAYSERSTEAEPPLSPEGVEAVAVSEDGRAVTFHVPVPSNDSRMVVGSAPITIALENEDAGQGETAGNARLDPGEDTNEDGVLTRQLVRTEGDASRVLGSANCIADVRFNLRPTQGGAPRTVLEVELTGTKRYGGGEGRLISAQLRSDIVMSN